MATPSKRGRFSDEQVYGENNLVDSLLFNELAKHIAATKARSLAEYLGLSETEDDILQDFLTKEPLVQCVSSTKWF